MLERFYVAYIPSQFRAVVSRKTMCEKQFFTTGVL